MMPLDFTDKLYVYLCWRFLCQVMRLGATEVLRCSLGSPGLSDIGDRGKKII